MGLVSTIENAVDIAVRALGDSITKVDRASITVGPHVPGQPPSRQASFTKCDIAVIAMKVEDFPSTQIESKDLSVLDIRPITPATLDDRYKFAGAFYKVMYARNSLAGENIVLQELVLRPSDNGGVTWP